LEERREKWATSEELTVEFGKLRVLVFVGEVLGEPWIDREWRKRKRRNAVEVVRIGVAWK
jgi:hypothetical protein